MEDRQITPESSHWPPPSGCPAVAELGTAHNGDPVKARELVDAAAEAGAWAVKIQLFYADEILPPNAGLVPLPGGDTPLYEVFRRIETATMPPRGSTDAPFYRDLRDYAQSRGLVFFGTPFGAAGAAILANLDTPFFKVASPELNHEPLLRVLAGYGRPIILSTGVSTLGDIERALAVIEETRKGLETLLLHCVTAYPAPPEESNLRLIPTLTSLLGKPVGLSDHSLDPLLVPALAASLGARLVEKHLTLDKSAGGLDDPVALDPGDFATMCAALREFSGLEVAEATKRLAAAYPAETVAAVLGSGVKRLAPAEAESYERTNRSLHALADLAAGTRLTAENCAPLRTEKVLRPGISPRHLPAVLGQRVTRDVPAGEGIRWADLIGRD